MRVVYARDPADTSSSASRRWRKRQINRTCWIRVRKAVLSSDTHAISYDEQCSPSSMRDSLRTSAKNSALPLARMASRDLPVWNSLGLMPNRRGNCRTGARDWPACGRCTWREDGLVFVSRNLESLPRVGRGAERSHLHEQPPVNLHLMMATFYRRRKRVSRSSWRIQAFPPYLRVQIAIVITFRSEEALVLAGAARRGIHRPAGDIGPCSRKSRVNRAFVSLAAYFFTGQLFESKRSPLRRRSAVHGV